MGEISDYYALTKLRVYKGIFMKVRRSNMLWSISMFFLAYCACWLNMLLYRAENLKNAGNSQLFIDGTDFTPAVELGETAANGAVSFFTSVGYGIFIFIISLVVAIVFKLAVIKKMAAYEAAYKTKMFVFKVMAFFSLGLSVLITRFNYIFTCLIYTGIWCVVVYFILVLPLRKLQGELVSEDLE